jgi:predicted transcriptional regulator
MATMTRRTSFALDEGTIRRLKRLAQQWRVSQAEVLRRAIRDAAEKAEDRGDPVARLRAFHARGGLAAATARVYLREVDRDRSQWRRSR